MLQAVNISKTFPGSKALDGVNMTFQINKAKTEEILPDLTNDLIKRSYEGWKVLINK